MKVFTYLELPIMVFSTYFISSFYPDHFFYPNVLLLIKVDLVVIPEGLLADSLPRGQGGTRARENLWGCSLVVVVVVVVARGRGRGRGPEK